MNRQLFLTNLVSLVGMAAIPKNLQIQYQKIYLLQFFVRGFQFNEGKKILHLMKSTDLLELKREPYNQYDNFAIAIYYQNFKIGFVPAEKNEVLARLMDANMMEIMAEITHVELQSESWENCCCAIFILKKIVNKSSKDSNIPTYLSEIENPIYYTLENKNDRYSKIKSKPSRAESIYDLMVEHSQTDEVYTLIHNSFANSEAFEQALSEAKIIMNTEKIPQHLYEDKLLFAVEDAKLYLENAIEGKKYIFINMDRMPELVNEIKEFRKIVDDQGREFYEMVFKEIIEAKEIIHSI